MKSDIRCQTKECVKARNLYTENSVAVLPPHYNRPPSLSSATARCLSCGGYFDGKTWKHVCHSCGTEVKPGELIGYLVPAKCAACAKDKKGNMPDYVCSGCNHLPRFCTCDGGMA